MRPKNLSTCPSACKEVRRVKYGQPSALDNWLVSALATLSATGIRPSRTAVDTFGGVLRDVFHQDSVECAVVMTKIEMCMSLLDYDVWDLGMLFRVSGGHFSKILTLLRFP